MKNKIEVGEYVRTKKGKIDIYLNSSDFYNKDASIIVCKKSKYWFEDIRKHSSNIIDLIEEGDVVKVKDGKLIFYVGIEKGDEELTTQSIVETIKNKEVELLSIVTHEQIKNIEYTI